MQKLCRGFLEASSRHQMAKIFIGTPIAKVFILCLYCNRKYTGVIKTSSPFFFISLCYLRYAYIMCLYHTVNRTIESNSPLAAGVPALRPSFQWPMEDSPRALFYPPTPGPLADSWLNAGSIIRLQRDGTLPLRFRRESFEFRLPIKLKCNFPSLPSTFPDSAIDEDRPCFSLRRFFLAVTLYLSRTKSQTFGAITSEAPRYYDAYCSFTARNGAGGVVLATRWGQSATVPYQIKRSLFAAEW